MDNGFWIDKAYHGSQPHNQRAFRQIANHLRNRTAAGAVRQTVWKLREDIIDLYRLTAALDTGSCAQQAKIEVILMFYRPFVLPPSLI